MLDSKTDGFTLTIGQIATLKFDLFLNAPDANSSSHNDEDCGAQAAPLWNAEICLRMLGSGH